MKCEIVHESMFLPKLIRKTTTGRILMPDHGLDNHWDQQAMLELLNSIRKGFPIGTLTLYHTAERGPWVNHAGPTTVPTRVSGSALYVIDGTERIRTIMGLLGPADDDDGIIDDIDWRIYYDLDTGEFRRRRYGRQQAQDIPVRTVLNTSDFLTAGHEVNSPNHRPGQGGNPTARGRSTGLGLPGLSRFHHTGIRNEVDGVSAGLPAGKRNRKASTTEGPNESSGSNRPIAG